MRLLSYVSLLFAALPFSSSLNGAAPPNDNFANRIALIGAALQVDGSNVGATEELNEPKPFLANSVWWSWTAPVSGRVSIDNRWSDPGFLGVYTGTTVVGLAEITSGFGVVSFDATQGSTYQIMVKGYFGDSGGIIRFDLATTVGDIIAPTNDTRFIGPTNVLVQMASTAPGTVLTNAEVYFAFSPYEQATNFVGAVAQAPFSLVWSNVTYGTYYLVVRAAESTGVISTSAPVRIVVVPRNDDFTNRITLSGRTVVTNVTVSPASNEPHEPPGYPTNLTCVWFQWTAPTSGLVRIDADAAINVYHGSTLATLVWERGDFPMGYPPLTFLATAGETYQISLGGWRDDRHDTELRLELFGIPANDYFTNRIVLSGNSIVATGSNFVDAIFEPGEPNHAGASRGRSVWWTWTAPESGDVTITTDGSTFEAALGVYTGTTVDNLAPVYAPLFARQINFFALAGTTYQIAVDGFGGAYGYIQLGIDLVPMPPAANDAFANRIPLTGSSLVVSGSTVAATREPGETEQDGCPQHRSVWYTWTAPTNGGVSFQISWANSNPRITFYTGDTLANLSPIASYPCCPWPSSGCALGFATRAGTTYQIAVDSFEAPAGEFTFRLDFTQSSANDNFADRKVISGLPVAVTGTNVFTSAEPGEPVHSAWSTGHSVWFSWTATDSGVVTFEAGGHGLGIYTGTNLTVLTTITNKTGVATISAVAGITYQIAIEQGGDSNPFNLRIVPPPVNDNFASRLPVPGTNIVFNGTSRGATGEFGEPNPNTFNTSFHRSVWWTWTAPALGLACFSASSREIPQPIVAAYTGSNLYTLQTVAVASNYTGRVSFLTAAGSTYQFQIEGFGGASGDLTLWLSLSRPPTASPNGTGRLPNGHFRIRVTGEDEQRFSIQASTNLVNWTNLVTTTLNDITWDFIDTNAPALPVRFYRVLPLP